MIEAELAQRILVPRPNGSRALEQVAALLEATLRSDGAQVASQPFAATPHGFEIVFCAALALAIGFAVALGRGRSRTALALLLAAAGLLFAEMDLLWSPLSGLAGATLRNVVGTFPGAAGGPRLVFVAHYDTTTHFGSHAVWGPVGFTLGPAVGLGAALAITGAARARRGRALAAPLRALAWLVVAPFAAMAWFHAAGPWLRAPSPGAIDDGGSVLALLQLAGDLAARPADSPVTVVIVFTAAEEERALGSWAHAAALPREPAVGVVNLEGVGLEGPLGLATRDGFASRRYASPQPFVDWVERVAGETGEPLARLELPPGTLTDARSYLARGIPAVTLRASEGGAFPAGLHSARDAADRLSPAAIDRAVALLEALVRSADADPRAFAAAARGR